MRGSKNVWDYSGSSEHLKKEIDLKKIINRRLIILSMVLIFLAAVLIYRLYYIQIIDADHYEALLAKNQANSVKMTTMRGEFYDRNGNILVSNQSVNSITYFPEKSMKDSEKWALAQKFANTFDLEFKLYKEDKKNLWLLLNKESSQSLLTEQERESYQNNEISEDEVEVLIKEKIDDAMLESLTAIDQKAFYVYSAMNSAVYSQAGIVKENASNEEIAYLSEHKNEFPGFSFQTTWDREYTEGIDLSSLIGSVSSIPSEKRDYFLSLGYQINDQVGSYGLEYMYESLLSGVKSEYEGAFGEGKLLDEGRKGYDLVMAIDADLQKKTQEILVETMENVKNEARRKPFKEMQMVVTDPKTGDILSIAVMKRDKDGNYYNDPQAAFLFGYPLGSTVKGATVYMGLDTGVVKEGEIINDSPMYIAGTPTRHSFINLGAVNDLTALQKSSNIYMFEIAIRMGGSRYIPNAALRFPNAEDTYSQMRNYFSQFGLGVKTQVDYPREETPYKGSTDKSGHLLDLAIGQFDNYTVMQLSQYITTIANGGYRLKPRLVTQAINPDTQSVVYENQVEILNILDNKEAISRVQEGMRLCVAGNWCGPLYSASYTAAGKTGTAQDFMAGYDGVVRHNTYVAFAPFEEPEIAVACIAPYTYYEEGGGALTNLCMTSTKKVMDEYMNKR